MCRKRHESLRRQLVRVHSKRFRLICSFLRGEFCKVYASCYDNRPVTYMLVVSDSPRRAAVISLLLLCDKYQWGVVLCSAIWDKREGLWARGKPSFILRAISFMPTYAVFLNIRDAQPACQCPLYPQTAECALQRLSWKRGSCNSIPLDLTVQPQIEAKSSFILKVWLKKQGGNRNTMAYRERTPVVSILGAAAIKSAVSCLTRQL